MINNRWEYFVRNQNFNIYNYMRTWLDIFIITLDLDVIWNHSFLIAYWVIKWLMKTPFSSFSNRLSNFGWHSDAVLFLFSSTIFPYVLMILNIFYLFFILVNWNLRTCWEIASKSSSRHEMLDGSMSKTPNFHAFHTVHARQTFFKQIWTHSNMNIYILYSFR